MSSSLRSGEIEKFSKDAVHWWNENGPFAPLHALNPVRMAYIKQQICKHFNRDEKNLKALENLKILDIGCGGGLVCEPLARMGAHVVGIDADDIAIKVAKEHGEKSALKINYKTSTAEKVKEKFDVVLALEIIEHVEDPAAFVKTCASLIKSNGMIIFSTLNRTTKSYTFGIIAAEYILNWVPRGTHDWKKFIRPSELTAFSEKAGLKPTCISGLNYNPLEQSFALSGRRMSVNYFLTCTARRD